MINFFILKFFLTNQLEYKLIIILIDFNILVFIYFTKKGKIKNQIGH
jgi:hypothetical protein